MTLTFNDWIVIAAYFALNLAIGVYYARRARGSTSEFFLSGRDVPWWLAGTSMVATTFAADTPLLVTGIVARYGIAGNWLWWNMAASGMLTVFVYARLWRRAGVMTDVEFAEIRYAGRPAAFLRGFRALYLGVPINCIVIGWVNLAMLKILQVTLGLDASRALWALLAMLAFTAFYTTLAGLWGVLLTDLVQFVLKMGMVIALAYYAVRPWPWILTALASIVLYPTLVDKESGYVRTLMDPQVFPPALRGVMLAAFAAAYMSTIGTQLNWGASYVVNDVYRRFLRRASSEREYVIVSQAVTLGLMGA